MEFPNSRYPEGTPSYPSHEYVWNYLDSYATEHRLKDLIKYYHLVENVRSIPHNKWEITVTNLQNKQTLLGIYDAVFVCSGINYALSMPDIEGATKFKGVSMHSRRYRQPETFYGIF